MIPVEGEKRIRITVEDQHNLFYYQRSVKSFCYSVPEAFDMDEILAAIRADEYPVVSLVKLTMK